MFIAPSFVRLVSDSERVCLSCASQPGTADWSGSNCAQVRSAGGIYLCMSPQQHWKMHKVSLPEPERHQWELTEAPSSCLAPQHYWTWATTESAALEKES